MIGCEKMMIEHELYGTEKVLRRRAAIIEWLSKRQMTLQELAKKAGVTTKTVQRDIEYLRTSRKMPIESSRNGYHFRKASSAEVRRTDDEVLAAVMLAGGSIDRQFSRLPESLQRQMKSLNNEVIAPVYDTENLLASLDVEKHGISKKQLRLFGELIRAVVQRSAIAFDFSSLGASEVRRRSVLPVQLKEREGYWYLAAHDFDCAAPRVFSISRIANVEVIVDPVGWPSKEQIESIQSLGRFSMWDDGQNEPKEVRVRLHDYAAWLIRERTIHPSQELEEVSQDEVVLKLRTGDLTGVSLWLRRFAPLVEVLEPKSLRDVFCRDLEAAIERNKKGG